MPPGAVSPTLPPVPSPSVPLLPPPKVAPPHQHHAPNGMAMSLSEPMANNQDAWDWAVVFAVVLASEAALFWLMACLLVLRRRRNLNRFAHS
jgi:hypothetical protein